MVGLHVNPLDDAVLISSLSFDDMNSQSRGPYRRKTKKYREMSEATSIDGVEVELKGGRVRIYPASR